MKYLILFLLFSPALNAQSWTTSYWRENLELQVDSIQLDTFKVILGVIEEEITDFPPYKEDAVYYSVEDSIVILRLVVIYGYLVDRYYDYDWKPIDSKKIAFVKPRKLGN